MHFVPIRDEAHLETLAAFSAAPETATGRDEPTLREELLDVGVESRVMDEVVAVIDRHVEREAFHAAAGVLRRVAILLSTKGTTGAALSRCLGLGNERSLTELASCFSVSKQAVSQAEQRLRHMLLPILPSNVGAGHCSPVKRPTEPGEWLCAAESAKLAGCSPAVINSAAAHGQLSSTRVGRTRWYLEADVLTFAAKREADLAQREQRLESFRLGRPVSPITGA
jgi:hypothetical protein